MSKGSQSERAQLVDIGVNFHSAQLTTLTAQLLVRARAANVTQIVATGTSAASSRLAVELARANLGTVFATAGVHPHGAKSYDSSTFRELTELWKCPEVVAIGECGLDYNRNFSTPQAQRIAFEQQLSMALETRKPLFLHCRDAFTDFHDMLALWWPIERAASCTVSRATVPAPRGAAALTPPIKGILELDRRPARCSDPGFCSSERPAA